MKDWRARADWETLMFVVFARRRAGCPFDRSFHSDLAVGFGGFVRWVAKKVPSCCRSDALLKPARANTRRFRTPRTKFCECAGENIALYLYVTHMKLCEGLVSGLGQPSIFFCIFCMA